MHAGAPPVIPTMRAPQRFAGGGILVEEGMVARLAQRSLDTDGPCVAMRLGMTNQLEGRANATTPAVAGRDCDTRALERADAV